MTAGLLVCAGGFALGLAACRSPEGVARSSQVGQPPVAEKRPKTVTVHGDSRVDDYFWLRDKEDRKVLEYLKAEDTYADTVMKPSAELQETLYKEMVGHIKETDDTVPYRRGDYFYYSRTIAGLQYPVYCRKHTSLTAPEEIVLDLNDLAKGHSFMALGSYQPSDDGRLLAFSTDDIGYRQYTLQVKNLKTGALLPDRIERENGEATTLTTLLRIRPTVVFSSPVEDSAFTVVDCPRQIRAITLSS
jgi:oligopeptidase B